MAHTHKDTATYTQAQVETTALAALAGIDHHTPWETVSDAVDVHLGRIEADQGHPLDRNAIPNTTAGHIVDILIHDQKP